MRNNFEWSDAAGVEDTEFIIVVSHFYRQEEEFMPMRNRKSVASISRLCVTFIILLIPLLVSILGCSIPFSGGGSLTETVEALNAQITANVQTRQVQETIAAARETERAEEQAGELAQQATQFAQQTALAGVPQMTATPLSESTSTPEPSPTQMAISIADWRMSAFGVLNSGCVIPGATCWKLIDDKNQDAYLISRDEVTINSDWKSPYLVYWTKHDLNNTAHVSFEGDAGWVIVKNYSGSSSDWRQDFIDLSMFKGQDIIIQFYADVLAQYNEWFLQEIQIVPEFTPPF